MRKYIVILLLCVLNIDVWGQGFTDPTRAIIIADNTKKSTKVLDSLLVAQGLMTAGHLYMKSEIEKTTSFQRDFNEYLDSLHNLISYAAEIYGIYYDVTKISKSLKELKDVIKERPTNTFAVAVSTHSNRLYSDIYETGIKIVNDIRDACFSKQKLTEAQRYKIISKVRPKLYQLNRQIKDLSFAIYYTSFPDVWREINGRAHVLAAEDRRRAIERARQNWMNNIKRIH